MTVAETLFALKPTIDELWEGVDYVGRQEDGSDLYTYMDKSRIRVSNGVIQLVEV